MPAQLGTKYPYVCHAELNAIMNKNCESLAGFRMCADPAERRPPPSSTMCRARHRRYVTLFPCNECAKLIIQSRIAEVAYLSDRYHDTAMMKASRRMLELAGVRTIAHKPCAPRILIDFDKAGA